MNDSSPVSRRDILLACLLLTILILISGGLGVYVLSDPGLRQAHTMIAAAGQISTWYHEDVDWSDAVHAARNGMVQMLDRFSGYVTEEEFEQIHEDQSGGYSGIGVTITRHDEGLLVLTVRSGGPAGAAGVLPGDIITFADTIPLEGLSSREASVHLRGEDNTDVRLTLYRPAEQDTVQLLVTRGRIAFEHIPFAGYTPDSILYIRLVDFDPGASDDMAAALDSLVVSKDIVPHGVVLDLRGNPGGLFSEAYHTANLFLDEGEFIVGTDARSRWNSAEYFASGDDLTGGAPMIVIVDDGSASSAEIVAGALQQTGRAQLVGDTTYGKGLVQGFVHFADTDGLRLTIARYYLAGGVYLNDFDSSLNEIGHGLNPDFYFEFADQTDFPLAVEGSLLLQQFAYRHQNEILSEHSDTMSDDWIGRFCSFAAEHEFEYDSETTRRAEGVLAMADVADADRSVTQVARNLIAQARRLDLGEFYVYGTYLKARLEQLAIQRARSPYQAYAEVVLPSQPEIRFACDLIRDWGRDGEDPRQ